MGVSQNVSSPRRGLAFIPPVPRLAIVFLCSMLYIFIHQLYVAIGLMIVGVVIYFWSCRKNLGLAIAAIFPGVMLFLYNWLLSPADAGGWHWWILHINQVGLERGLVNGSRLIGVMLISFAWLNITPIPEMYQSLSWIKPIRPWVLELLRGVQIIKREFIIMTQSLIIRGLKWDSPLANVRNLVPLAMAIIPRVADNAQKTTFAMQSHQKPQKEPESQTGIQVDQVCVRYSPSLPDVLHDINLSIKPGEFIYLAGTDMAGKTTLLRLMGGVVPRIMGEYRGDVTIDGLSAHSIELSELSHLARYVAPEPFTSIYGITVGQEISFLTKNEEEGHAILRTMGIEHLWNRETTKLSGGQQVRLVLAGALASHARYLLLDSPMQELDPEGRADFLETLYALHRSNQMTVIVADPFWQQLRPLISRVLVMEEGKLIEDLSADKFFTDAWLERCHLLNAQALKPQTESGNVLAELENVSVSLEGNPILKGMNLQVNAGELLSIMGPNGSGKTTAMLTLAGAIKPNQGQVRKGCRVAYIFQDAKLQIVSDTVENELRLGPNILKWEKERTDEFTTKGLTWVGIDGETNTLDIHTSQARMLEIAACNTDADLIILDEPTVGLDSEGIHKIMDVVDTLLAKKKAVIIITHDENLAKIADRIVIIRDGVVDNTRLDFVE
ncbi:MAG: ATP-binding cassette domain-containing protein [Anaerolineaceae bacterium]